MESKDVYRCISIIGDIFIAPFVAIIVSFVLIFLGFRFVGVSGASSPDSEFSWTSFMHAIVAYIVPCLAVGSVLILVRRIGTSPSRWSAEKNSNPYLASSSDMRHVVGDACQRFGLLLLAAWIHLPVFRLYFPGVTDIFLPATYLAIVLLFISLLIRSINRTSPESGDSLSDGVEQ